ncbi:hypothetical protein [Paraburkholderia sp.]|uniref:hypothetical protein n=1 Tax=Paraburkholderia sp. TaxID=1926495 RepID=UPI0025D0EFDF|nr:hypothetical protein [Paraburkholderia sp.]
MQTGRCQVCEEQLGSRTHEFYSRTQKVVFEGKLKTVTVLYELQEMSFCGQECWEAMEKPIMDGLHPLYQQLHPVAKCCECQAPVDRTQPHYALYVGELEDVSQPWLASMRILDEREVAVFCAECRVPDGDLAAALGLLTEENDSVAAAESEPAKKLEPQS